MRLKRHTLSLALLFLLLTFIVGAAALAQTSAGFNLRWHVIAAGGQASSSSSYRVNGTIGQSIAGPPGSGSAGYAINSGYWFSDIDNWLGGTGRAVYLPAVLKE